LPQLITGEEGFAIVAAEQEDKPVQVLAQLGGPPHLGATGTAGFRSGLAW